MCKALFEMLVAGLALSACGGECIRNSDCAHGQRCIATICQGPGGGSGGASGSAANFAGSSGSVSSAGTGGESGTIAVDAGPTGP
jgi:Cys-rich repeat protein